MIIITNVNYIEVDGYNNVHELFNLDQRSALPVSYDGVDSGPEYAQVKTITEICRGREFINPQSQQRLVIGVSADASNLIGLQYEAWENMERESENMRLDLIRKGKLLCNSVDRVVQLESANLWTRIKAVFTGVR